MMTDRSRVTVLTRMALAANCQRSSAQLLLTSHFIQLFYFQDGLELRST
jgi:hypothetical protein